MMVINSCVRTVIFAAALHRKQACRFRSPQLGLVDGVQRAVDGVAETAAGIKEAYQDETFVPEGFVRASHILLHAAEGQSQQKAAALLKRIEEQEVTFADAALAFSSCPTRDLNGQLGIFQSLSRLTEGTLRADSMPYDGADTSDFDAVLFSALLGAVTVVDTVWGTHLILVEERGGEIDVLAQAADNVRKALGADAPRAPRGSARGFGGAQSKKSGGRRGKKRVSSQKNGS